MVKVKCPCGVQLQLADEWAGKRGKCPRCGESLEIPALDSVAATEAASALESLEQQPTAVEPPPPPRQSAPPPPPPQDDDPFAPPPTPIASDDAPPNRFTPVAASAPPLSSRQVAKPDSTAEPWHSQQVTLGKRAYPLYGVLAAGGTLAALLILAIMLVGSQLGGDQPIVENDPRATKPSKPAREVPGPDSEPSTPRNVPRESTPQPSPPQNVINQPLILPSENTPPPNEPVELVVADNAPPDLGVSQMPSQVEPMRGGSNTAGLSGASGRYDDQHCQMIQSQFGIRVPAAATMIEVNGLRLPVTNLAGLQESPSPYLMLPRGTHAVRWRAGELAVEVEIRAEHDQIYQDMRSYFALEGQVKTSELRSRSARAMDVHGAPYLLNFAGAAYATEQQWAAAERSFRRSLRVNPLYSPAHLNLAHCLQRAGKQEAARRELNLADTFNVGNVFGLNKAIVDLRHQIAAADSTVPAAPGVVVTEFLPEVYVSSQPRTENDRRLEALMQAMSKYAVRPAERGKILNNLAIHYSSSGRTELALEHFRAALCAVRQAGPERFTVARTIFANMQAACEATGFEEAAEYAHMQQAVRP